MAAQNKKELQEIKSLQQDLNNLLQKREEAGESVTRGLKKEISMYNTLIDKGKEAVENGLISSKQAKNQAKSVLKVAKVKNNLKDIDKELAKNAKFMLRSGKLKNKTNFNNLKASRALLKGKKRRLQVEHAASTVAEKAKGALMSQVAQGGLLVTIFAGLKKLTFAFAGKIDMLGKSFGVAGVSSGYLQTNLFDSSENMIKLGAGLEEAISITNVLSSDFGFSADESARLADNIFDSSVAMGLSADEGAKLFGILMSMGNMTQGQAEDLAESTYQLAQANKVAPQAVMKDIAENADIFAKNMKDGGKNVMEAAVQAKKLGLSLSDVDSIAGGLLDFQGSLNAEIEASIMLGRDVNLQKARELALDNDLTGMMNEVVKQAGGEAEFSKLNRLERESIAKALGVSVSQMAKLVGETGKLEAPKSFADIAGDKAMSNLTNIINEFKSFGATLLNKVGPIFEKTFEKFHDFIKSGEGIATMKEYALGFIDTLTSLPGIIKKIVAGMIVLKTISIGVAIAQAAIMAFKMGSITFGAGAAIGLGIAYSTYRGLNAMKSFQDLPPGQSASLVKGQAIFDPGETVVHTEDLKNMGTENRLEQTNQVLQAVGREMTELRKDMERYFGTTGTVPNKIGSAVARNITTAIK